MLESILSSFIGAFIGFAISLIVYLAITDYRWQKLKCHVIEAIETLNLWDIIVNTPAPSRDVLLSITRFLDEHNYEHCFNEQGGGFKLFYMLVEIANEHVQEKA